MARKLDAIVANVDELDRAAGGCASCHHRPEVKEELDEILGLIEPELKHLVGDATEVVFKTAPTFDARWEAGRFRKVIENAMKDRQVDLVLGIGALVTQEEKKVISEALRRTNWNRRKAAKLLEISYRSLLYKIKDYGIVS